MIDFAKLNQRNGSIDMFSLDLGLAAQADANVGDRITEACAAIFTITQCWEEISKNGSVGFKLNLKRDDGAEAKHVTLWHKNAEGKSNFNTNKIHGLMYVCQLRTFTKKKGKIKKWDEEQRKEVEVLADIFPEFLNKKVGFCLNAEEYEGKTKMVLDHSFDPQTKLTASESIEKKPAKIVERMIEKYMKQPKKEAAQNHHQEIAPQAKSTVNFDDDIPF